MGGIESVLFPLAGFGSSGADSLVFFIIFPLAL